MVDSSCLTLDHESPDDWWGVEMLLDTCFAPGRSALSSYRLRDGRLPLKDLCFVLRRPGGDVVGCVRNWAVQIGSYRSLLLGPIAVHPTSQGEGLGALMMHKVISQAKEQGETRILLVGDLPLYQRFGFERLIDVHMPPPTNPDRILGLALEHRSWDGVLGDVSP